MFIKRTKIRNILILIPTLVVVLVSIRYKNDIINFLYWPVEKIKNITMDIHEKNKSVDVLRAENLQLKYQLSLLQERINNQIIPSEKIQVLQHLDNGFSKTVLIQKPNDVKTKTIVDPDGNIVGKIIELGHYVAKVRLITDGQSKIAVYGNNYRGILVGNSSNQLTLERVENKGNDPVIGDTLYCLGIEGIYIQNTPIAKITQIDGDKIFAKPLWNKLDFVYAQKKY